jgi:peptidoglycan/LPS O-acetylase OafA/YrhL
MHGTRAAQASQAKAYQYRADIDGLRAVAVLSVIAFHYGLPIPGGFTGVDVFFVISGFLITERLLADIEGGSFSIIGFYDRRARRILPAFMVMLAVTMLLGNFLLWPGDYKALGASGAKAVFGLSNNYFLDHTGYFDQSADLMPLLHTWSLAVEEQFYVVWPILLFAISFARKRTTIGAIVGVLAVAGFVLSLWWMAHDSKAAFFLALPRAWELLLGALIVFLPALGARIAPVAAAVGLTSMVAGFVVASDKAFPGVTALLPCIGTALLIWPREKDNRISGALGSLWPVGLISYSLYLWHWPIWVGYRVFLGNGQPSPAQTLALFVAVLTVATLSWRFIERPFRRQRLAPWRTVLAGALTCAVAYIGPHYIDKSEGRPGRIPAESQSMRSSQEMWNYSCPQAGALPEPLDCVVGADWKTAASRGLIWGDSHTLHLLPFLDIAGREANVAIAVLYACSPPLGGRVKSSVGNVITLEAEAICERDRKMGFDLIEQHPELEFVILASRWSAVLGYFYTDDDPARSVARGRELLKVETKLAVDRILASGKRIALVSDIPAFEFDPIPCATIKASPLWRSEAACEKPITFIPRAKIAEQGDVTAIYDDIAHQAAGAMSLSLSAAMCRGSECMTYLDGEFLYRDEVHLRRNLQPRTNVDLAHLLGLGEMLNRLSSERD